LLLDNLPKLAGYVPVDISGDYLCRVALKLQKDYPEIPVRPVVADFTLPFSFPDSTNGQERRIVYFPGSTIGNFTADEAHIILRQMAEIAGPTGGVLIGVDLVKPVERLLAAYNDAKGVTAQFHLNLLCRLNHELGADFGLDQFRHEAIYNETEARIEM
jgi:L-histidine N-alpha-methyltransferase